MPDFENENSLSDEVLNTDIEAEEEAITPPEDLDAESEDEILGEPEEDADEVPYEEMDDRDE